MGWKPRLTPNEKRLLDLLKSRPGDLIEYDEFVFVVGSSESLPNLRKMICQLRAKIKATSCITSIRGSGYVYNDLPLVSRNCRCFLASIRSG